MCYDLELPPDFVPVRGKEGLRLALSHERALYHVVQKRCVSSIGKHNRTTVVVTAEGGSDRRNTAVGVSDFPCMLCGFHMYFIVLFVSKAVPSHLVSLREVADYILESRAYKPRFALVIIDFLVRHGALPPH